MPTRRDFLRFAAAAAALGPLACNRGSGLGARHEPRPAGTAGEGRPLALPRAGRGEEERRVARLLGRAGYGPRPGDIERVSSIGTGAWIEQQLSPDSISDFPTFWKVRRIETVALGTPDLFDFPQKTVVADLRRATIIRAAGSERQLLEAMVEFWTDHFNVYTGKADCGWLKVVDDRDVIRRHALGRFRDLLRASAESPAMLAYLDGRANAAGAPNENHARELLELHALGVGGGYTQSDVQELARALTGWRLRSFWHRGRAFLETARHDDSPKRILGSLFASGARNDLEAILDRLAGHPSTAERLARKLCRRFVADEPDPALVRRAAAAFTASQGSIRATLDVLLRSDELAASPPKWKRPFAYAISALRALPAGTDGGLPIQARLAEMGQLPFDWPTPDGYPDGEEHWRSGVLPRWNFALALASGEIRGTPPNDDRQEEAPPSIASRILGRPLAGVEKGLFVSGSGSHSYSHKETLALALAHPDFQYC